MRDAPRPFPIRYAEWSRWLMTLFGLGPRQSWVEVRHDAVLVRMGWAFRATVPRGVIASARSWRNVWWAIGVHTDFRGSWLVNGSSRGIVAVELASSVPAWTMGIPIRVRRLGIGLEDPDGFIVALATR